MFLRTHPFFLSSGRSCASVHSTIAFEANQVDVLAISTAHSNRASPVGMPGFRLDESVTLALVCRLSSTSQVSDSNLSLTSSLDSNDCSFVSRCDIVASLLSIM